MVSKDHTVMLPAWSLRSIPSVVLTRKSCDGWLKMGLCFPFLFSRVTMLIKLSCETNQEINYLPGDHLGIFPANREALVDGIISHVADAPPFNENFRLETCRDRKLGVLFPTFFAMGYERVSSQERDNAHPNEFGVNKKKKRIPLLSWHSALFQLGKRIGQHFSLSPPKGTSWWRDGLIRKGGCGEFGASFVPFGVWHFC